MWWYVCPDFPARFCLIVILVTPLFDVRLEDVLDRKHLPPLGS